MEKKQKKHVINVLMLSLALMFVSCASISKFDQYAYVQSTSIKVDALNVMSLAVSNYELKHDEVRVLETNLQKIYEYEKNRPKNVITLKMWDKLLNKEGHLLGGFLERWKKEGRLSIGFITESKEQVGEAFDIISGLESRKIKSSVYK